MFEPELSLVIASPNPTRLAEFYSYALNVKAQVGSDENHYVIHQSNGKRIQIYKPSQDYLFTEAGRRVSFCLTASPSRNPLSSIEKWSLMLIARGATSLEEPSVQTFGAETWLADPEGNEFLILVPTYNNKSTFCKRA